MTHLLKRSCEKEKQDKEELEESGVTLDDLPDLPFEKILNYLNLEDCIKARAVSKSWQVDFVHGEPVEKLISDRVDQIEAEEPDLPEPSLLYDPH
ncbi:hypothetical protein L1887_53914 [Cichorium endivia]|nr:hypothetical protein L1887_53914 [Cichorium endivia]